MSHFKSLLETFFFFLRFIDLHLCIFVSLIRINFYCNNILCPIFIPISPLPFSCFLFVWQLILYHYNIKFHSLFLSIYSHSGLWKTCKYSYYNITGSSLWSSASIVYIYEEFTISQELEQGQVDGSLPAWILLQGNAITSGSKHFTTANGNQLAALIFASHVIQHSSIIDKGIQFPSRVKKRIFTQMAIMWLFGSALALSFTVNTFLRCLADTYPVLRLLRASSTPFWLYLTMWECISG